MKTTLLVAKDKTIFHWFTYFSYHSTFPRTCKFATFDPDIKNTSNVCVTKIHKKILQVTNILFIPEINILCMYRNCDKNMLSGCLVRRWLMIYWSCQSENYGCHIISKCHSLVKIDANCACSVSFERTINYLCIVLLILLQFFNIG